MVMFHFQLHGVSKSHSRLLGWMKPWPTASSENSHSNVIFLQCPVAADELPGGSLSRRDRRFLIPESRSALPHVHGDPPPGSAHLVNDGVRPASNRTPEHRKRSFQFRKLPTSVAPGLRGWRGVGPFAPRPQITPRIARTDLLPSRDHCRFHP